MYNAFITKDTAFEGRFFVAVKTTGIFCRLSCTAKKPKKENVIFFDTSKECLTNGFRPCLVCKPLSTLNDIPKPIKEILQQLQDDPFEKIKDAQLSERGIEPSRLRRWFLKQYGITFQAYQRMMRMGAAAKKLKSGESVTTTAFDTGFESLSGFGDSFKNAFGVSPKNGKDRRIIYSKKIETPLGMLVACAVDEGICLLEFADRQHLEEKLNGLSDLMKARIVAGESEHFQQLEVELKSYFEGALRGFTVPIFPVGTAFQKDVWEALRAIPYGQTRSYKEQALTINKPGNVRAVANANGRNRIAIIIPCHRVIGSDGSMTGYAGGLWRKKYLLDLEKKILHEAR